MAARTMEGRLISIIVVKATKTIPWFLKQDVYIKLMMTMMMTK